MTINLEISPIVYRRKEIDHGVILGSRKFKWMLKRKYSPLWAKDLSDKTYIATLSPHKRNFHIYIPASSLRVGMRVQIHDHPYKQNTTIKTLRVVKITKNSGFFGMGDSVSFEVEKEEVIAAKVDFSQDKGYVPTSQDECPFGDYVQPSEPVQIVEHAQEMPQETIFVDEYEEEEQRMSFDEYIGNCEEETPQEPQTEEPIADNPTMFVLPQTQTAFELPKGENYMRRSTFLKMPLVVAAACPRADDHAQQQAFTLPVCPLPVRKKQQPIMPEQPLLIALSGHQYGLFERRVL